MLIIDCDGVLNQTTNSAKLEIAQPYRHILLQLESNSNFLLANHGSMSDKSFHAQLVTRLVTLYRLSLFR